MSRSLDREEEKPESSGVLEGLSRSGAEQRPRIGIESTPQPSFGANRRERFLYRGQEYQIRPSESEALKAIGTFRVVKEDDLVRGVYGGNSVLAQADFRSLRRQGLVRPLHFQQLGSTHVHVLTGRGYNVLTARTKDLQIYYSGIVKPAEVSHDALLYGAFLSERGRIVASGGVVKNVVLDSKLKSEYFSRLNRPDEKRRSYWKAQAESALELHLPVVDGHVRFPDFRIEFENERGEMARVDVEVATENYRGQHVAAKVGAGFHVYTSASLAGRPQVQSGSHLRGNVFPQETRMTLPL